MNELLIEDLDTLPGFSPKLPGEDYYNYKRYIGNHGVSYFVHSPDIDPTNEADSYSHIDSTMRYFVHLMRVNGLFTTTSWEGVSDSKKYFENLKSEEKEIRKNGIPIIEFNTGKEFFFKDNNYRVPWDSPQAFADIGTDLRNDRLGLLVPHSYSDFIERLKENTYQTGLSSMEYKEVLSVGDNKYAHFDIQVRHEQDVDRLNEWRGLSVYVLNNLGKKIIIQEVNK